MRRPAPTTLVATAIVTFWLVMMGLLAHREGLLRWHGTAFAPGEVATTADSWMGIFLGDGRRVGFLHLRQAPATRRGENGFGQELTARLTLNLLGTPSAVTVDGHSWRAADARRAELAFSVASGDYRVDVEGRLEGGELVAEVHTAGESFPWRLPLDGEALLDSGLGTALAFRRLEVGQRVKVATIDPLTLSAGEARVRCLAREPRRLGDTVVATRRLEVTSGGFTSLVWIDDAGQVVRAETPLGLSLERLTPQEALAATPEATGDFLRQTAVTASGARPFRGARRMTVRLAGLGAFRPPTDDVQESAGDGLYRITVPPADAAEGASTTEHASPFLAADAFVQSDHPRIRRTARDITAAAATPWQRLLALNDWVYTRLDKEPVMSLPSALEVLTRRRGDCNEHTVLFTALARAAGLPTRIALGVVWSDEHGGFYYHAWPEVRLGGRWLWTDPTLGQPLADATHLKLVEGGVESWPRLLPYLGRLGVEVVRVE